MDNFLKSTDPSYAPSPPSMGETFVRRMNTYGGVRPSVGFTAEGREAKLFKGPASTFTMSNLPPLFYDYSGDKRSYSYTLPTFNEVDNEKVMKMLQNNDLMMPSERQKEHQALKKGIMEWKRARAELFEYKKKKRVLERAHRSGITAVDSALFPETELYAEPRHVLQAQAEILEKQANGRREHLTMQSYADDATTARNYGDPYAPEIRSLDIPLQRKCVDQRAHPFRFMNTYERLWPKHEPQWDPERAKILRHHDVRHKRYNIINQSENEIQGIRVRADPGAPSPQEPAGPGAPQDE